MVDEIASEGLLFALGDVSYSPVAPKMNEPFTVKGKIGLFKIPFFGPLWIIATVTYPETWWEEIIPIIGSPEVRATDIALGGNFEITFAKGFQREGEFSLSVRVYPGPTIPIDSIVLPPAPAAATVETTFIVAGEAPPEELGFNHFIILSYSKNGGTPVTSPDTLDLNVGDRLRINVSFEHMGDAVTAGLYGAIGNLHHIPADWLDEVLKEETTINVPSSLDWVPYTDYYVEIPITSALDPGTYSIYAKIRRITGGDILSPYLENVITIAGGAAPLSDLQITSYDSPVGVGDICQVQVRFTYQGPATSKTLYAAIGNAGVYFDEIVKGSTTISIPRTDSWLTYEKTVKIYISTAIDPAGSPYDLYAKVDGVISPTLESVINIAGGVPSQNVKNLRIIDYDSKVDMGDYCAITVEFEYIGKACSGTLRAAIGNAGTLGFDEVKYDQDYVSIPQSMTWTRYSFNLSIPTSGMSAGYYDLYAKIGGGAPSLIGPFLYNVVEIVAAVPNPEIRNFKISSYDSQVQPGGYCQVKCSFEYQGPANSGTLRAAIGNAGTFGFDEIVYDTESISVPETPSWRAYTATARIYISTAISAGVYDLYAKITGALPNVITPTKYNVITVTKVTVSFKMTIWGIPSDFGSYDHWSCYYYDTGIGGFVSDEKWYSPSSKISFSGVKPGGYLAVILAKGSVASNYYYSPIFTAVGGGIYQYDLQLNRVSKIG